MIEEAHDRLPEVRDELQACVLDILEDKPDGVGISRMQFHISRHPDYDIDPIPIWLYPWLAELKRDGVLVIDHLNRRYLHPKHAEKDPEEYRPDLGFPDHHK